MSSTIQIIVPDECPEFSEIPNKKFNADTVKLRWQFFIICTNVSNGKCLSLLLPFHLPLYVSEYGPFHVKLHNLFPSYLRFSSNFAD